MSGDNEKFCRSMVDLINNVLGHELSVHMKLLIAQPGYQEIIRGYMAKGDLWKQPALAIESLALCILSSQTVYRYQHPCRNHRQQRSRCTRRPRDLDRNEAERRQVHSDYWFG